MMMLRYLDANPDCCNGFGKCNCHFVSFKAKMHHNRVKKSFLIRKVKSQTNKTKMHGMFWHNLISNIWCCTYFQLIEEFKRAHKKMFAHTMEDEGSSEIKENGGNEVSFFASLECICKIFVHIWK